MTGAVMTPPIVPLQAGGTGAWKKGPPKRSPWQTMIMTLDMDVTAERRHYNTHCPLKGKRLTTFCALLALLQNVFAVHRRAIRNPRPEGPSNLRTLRPIGPVNPKNLHARKAIHHPLNPLNLLNPLNPHTEGALMIPAAPFD